MTIRVATAVGDGGRGVGEGETGGDGDGDGVSLGAGVVIGSGDGDSDTIGVSDGAAGVATDALLDVGGGVVGLAQATASADMAASAIARRRVREGQRMEPEW